jgi:hypothetical protein
MLNFGIATINLLLDPVMWLAAAVLAYLFSIEMKKLSWSLLLFIVPSLPTLSTSPGMMLDGIAKPVAGGLLSLAAYQALEAWKARPIRRKTGT